jgi:hypothetical protein
MSLIFKRFCLIAAWCFSLSCTDSPFAISDPEPKKYSIYIMGKDGSDYLLETNSLSSGKLAPEKDGFNIDDQNITRTVFVKDGFYYHSNRKTGQFSKYKSNSNAIHEIAALPLQDFSLENKYWISNDTLLLTGLNNSDFSQVKYALVKTSSMELLASGDMDIPRPSGKFDNMSVCFVERRAQKLFVAYTYHQQLGHSDYTTSDTTYVSTLQYPKMKALSTAKDTRSTYPGGINTIQPYSFNDEQQNYYFMLCPGIALGNRPKLPTGILRINAGADVPDPNYFFDISAQITNHAYGMWNLGDNQAIIRAERKDLFKGLSDHWSTPHFEFYLLNVTTGKVLKKLDLPLDKGTRRECVLVQDGIAYISVNSTKEGNFIWLYDIHTGTLKKGLQLIGDTDFIMRIDRLSH